MEPRSPALRRFFTSGATREALEGVFREKGWGGGGSLAAGGLSEWAARVGGAYFEESIFFLELYLCEERMYFSLDVSPSLKP